MPANAGLRTPIGKHRGALARVRPDDLSALVLQGLAQRSGVDAGEIEDVFWGCANQAGEDNRNVGRMAVLLAGWPERVAAVTINRLCASGLEAAVHPARCAWAMPRRWWRAASRA
jgi:acetyl-CoA acyltransferase